MHHLPYSFWGPWRLTDPRPNFFSLASLAVLHLLFHNSLLLLKVLKALNLMQIHLHEVKIQQIHNARPELVKKYHGY